MYILHGVREKQISSSKVWGVKWVLEQNIKGDNLPRIGSTEKAN